MQSTPHVSLRKEAFLKAAEKRGYSTGRDSAIACGVDPGQYSRVMSDQSMPGGRFIACVLLHFPECTFEDLFEVVPASEPVRSAA